MNELLLSVTDCSFAYRDGGFQLAAVSVGVHAGEVLGIVGPNGSGKSTLLRLMGGLLRPSGGRVELGGRPVSSFGRRGLARRMGFLPQSPETAFPFSARQVVAMGRYPHQSGFGFLSRDDVRVIEQALAETDSGGVADRDFMTLSGGEKQRVLVASVLAQEPSLMLLDEPTAALDIHHEAEVFDLLRRLSRTGIGAVVVTHNLNAASQFCDRLLLLSGGGVACCGPAGQVLEQEMLSRVYRADVRVVRNPLTDTPMVIVMGRSPDEGE